MHTLLVGQHERLEWNANMLRIDALEADRITLAFHEKEFVEPTTVMCTAEALIEAFERFIHRAKWLSA